MIEELKFLPLPLCAALGRLDFGRLYEIRLRADKPVRVCYDGKFFYLSPQGLLPGMSAGTVGVVRKSLQESSGKTTQEFPQGSLQGYAGAEGALWVTAAQIGEIVLRAAEFSIYACNNQLSGGYITIRGGIRIGVAGEVVYEGDRVKTQKNFSSLVIRIPHEIKGSADAAFASLQQSGNKNMLLISPPGCGKTTILRDITRQVSNAGANVLLVDERSEIAASRMGVAALDVGVNTDVIDGARKEYAFSFGLRSLRPDYIVTDELMGADDIEAVRRAALSGVNVIASIHAGGERDIRGRKELLPILTSGVFGRFVFLSLRRGAGTYEKILDGELNPI